MTRISINSMLRGEFASPLFPGNRLENIGKFLGAPDRWDFGIEDQFSCLPGYGDFELRARALGDRVEVERLWVELWDTDGERPIPKTAKIRLARRIHVDLGKFEAGLPLSTAKAALDSFNPAYQEVDPMKGFEVIKQLFLPTNATLDFFKGEQEPILMEIHFFSATSNA